MNEHHEWTQEAEHEHGQRETEGEVKVRAKTLIEYGSILEPYKATKFNCS